MIVRFLQKKVRGVAILTVLVALALMMAIVTELSSKEVVRYKLALNERDALQAEALAKSGANFAQLILMVQEPLQTYMANFAKAGISLPNYTVWEMVPIDSDFLKGVTEGSVPLDLDFMSGNKEAKEKKPIVAEKAKEVPLVGPYQAPAGGYGGFAGRFSTEIEDEEKKISIRKWAKVALPKRKMIADQIYRILAKKEHEYLFDGTTGDNKGIGPSQLVANIYDYISDGEQPVDVSASAQNFGRDMLGGDKRSAYVDTPNIAPKRAPMDTMAELRLVPGVTDAIYLVLSKILTVYGEGDTINILSASDDVLATAFYMCTKNRETSAFQRPLFETELIASWNRKKSEGEQEISAEGMIKHLEENGVEVDKEECNKVVGTTSKTFTVKSTATVGTATKIVRMVVRSAGGVSTSYQFQYL